jgi:membrane protease YdiL (CAAX protease family)
MKWIAPSLAYLAAGVGLFVFHSAWGALLGFHGAIIGSLLIARPAIPVSILFKGKNIKRTLTSVMLCGFSGIALYILRDHLGFALDFPEQVVSLGLNASNWKFFIAYFTLANALIEEYFWRGYLGDKTKNLHTSDFMYAGYHAMVLFNKLAPPSILFALSVLVFAGWFWRQAAREDHGLLAPVLGHMTADFTILTAVYWMCTA